MSTTTTTPDTGMTPEPRKPLRKRTWFGVTGGLIAVAVIGGFAAGGHAKPAAATPSAASSAPAAPAQPATPPSAASQPAEPAFTSKVLLQTSGSGNWNSSTFQVQPTDNPQLKVTYTYTGNGSDGIASNFVVDVKSCGDDQSVANDIAWSGGKTTNVYPDLSMGGSSAYHVEITADGNWTITITQVA